jgi:hypothetical protein
MTNKNLSAVANDLIQSYGNTARNVLHAYRIGGERMAEFLEQRWERALDESRPQLTEEVAANALHAQKVIGGYWIKGLTLSTNSAEGVVTQLVKAAGVGVQRAAANASSFEEKTGSTALNTLASAAVPAAEVVGKLAWQLERTSAHFASRIAGDDTVAEAPVKRASAFRKARTTKAA